MEIRCRLEGKKATVSGFEIVRKNLLLFYNKYNSYETGNLLIFNLK